MPDKLEERLRGLLAKATKRPWVAFDRGNTLAIMKGPRPPLKANGYPIHPWPEIIAWTGFDDSDVPKRYRRTNLHLIVETVNALPDLLKALAEITRLKGEVEAAYREGFSIGDFAGGGNASTFALEQSWMNSNARRSLISRASSSGKAGSDA